MTQSDPIHILDALHAQLNREAALIRKADFTAMTGETERREMLMQRLGQAGTPPGDALETLRDHAQRNQALMSAALKGVRAARRRIEMLRSVQNSLNTYDNLGKRWDIVTDTASVERRA